ncbi:MAG: ribbon-helix-helix protein, CopG family [Oligoflexales bacterium]|nr:ribbon-helix-helix protein, CopG family [Oligoflexales bacterium]
MTTSVRLPEELEKKLMVLCAMTGRKKSSFIIEALTEHIQDLEDYYVVAQRMQDYDPTESVSLEDLKGLYEVED